MLNWFWSALWVLLKAVFAVAVLSGVWFASAVYHEKYYDDRADQRILIRVHRQCLRPDFVQTQQAAREYDVMMDEVQLLKDKAELVNRRMTYLLDETDKVDSLRLEVTQGKGKVKVTPGGMGGPAPNPKRKEPAR